MRTRDSAHKGREGGRDSKGEEHRKDMIFPRTLHGDQKTVVRLGFICSHFVLHALKSIVRCVRSKQFGTSAS